MPHQIHKTEGVVLGSEAKGEASRRLWILTPDLGLVAADARGLRKITSKLRYHLQDFSLAHINLVRGRETWRVTGAQVQRNFARAAAPAAHRAMANIARLIRRLCPGEESNPKLFEDTRLGLELIQTWSPSALPAAEALVVLRVLHRLGYVGALEHFSEAVTSPLNHVLLTRLVPNHQLLIAEINRALRVTHL